VTTTPRDTAGRDIDRRMAAAVLDRLDRGKQPIPGEAAVLRACFAAELADAEQARAQLAEALGLIADALGDPQPATTPEPTPCDAYQPPTTPENSGLCATCGMADWKHTEHTQLSQEIDAEPECKDARGCDKVVPCNPGCAVTSRALADAMARTPVQPTVPVLNLLVQDIADDIRRFFGNIGGRP
jgi:hypothetical protein